MSYRKTFNPSVYFVADPSACAGRDLKTIVMAAAKGGATMVQYRDKSSNDVQLLANARALQFMLKPLNIPFIVNDRVDIAMLSNADGVHLGQDDLPPADARRMLGPDKIIGVTAFKTVHFRYIDKSVVDYAGAGPFYPTKTKPDKPVLGVTRFKKLVEEATVPVVGVGGITPGNLEDVLRAGADGVAMMRAISASANPEKSAKNFVAAVAAAREKIPK